MGHLGFRNKSWITRFNYIIFNYLTIIKYRQENVNLVHCFWYCHIIIALLLRPKVSNTQANQNHENIWELTFRLERKSEKEQTRDISGHEGNLWEMRRFMSLLTDQPVQVNTTELAEKKSWKCLKISLNHLTQYQLAELKEGNHLYYKMLQRG